MQLSVCIDGKREAVTNIRFIDRLTIAPVILSLVLAMAPAVLAAAPPAPDVSGPVDIQANEQEFAGDQIIARGNVRVVYKDSIVHAPVATLQRDAEGNPQRAIFTGHPHFSQGKNVIEADTLTFDIANSRVVADGNSHSEVEQGESPDKKDEKTAKNGTDTKKSLITGPGKGDDSGPQRIITDADHQEYDRSSDKFEATGHVKVVHSDIIVHAEKLHMVYGTDKKPETAIFNGNVVAQRGQNNTMADTISYSLNTKRLQATGHVKSKVVQPKKDDKTKKADAGGAGKYPGDPGAAYGATAPDAGSSSSAGAEETIIVTSNSQESSEESGRLAADGNVRVYYQDMVGIGPKAILLRNSEGKADKVFFVGRSQVSQTGRRWIADRITISVADKKVLAVGNTRAFIIQQKPAGAKPDIPAPDGKLAGKPAAGGSSISSRKIETPQ